MKGYYYDTADKCTAKVSVLYSLRKKRALFPSWMKYFPCHITKGQFTALQPRFYAHAGGLCNVLCHGGSICNVCL